MSLAAVMSTALTGLSVSQNALGITANNIANASTPGYTRKREQQEAVILDGVGRGAVSAETSRSVDEFLDAQSRELVVQSGRSEALAGIHDRLQATLFGGPADPDGGLTGRVRNLTTALETLANSPDRAAPRLDVINRASDLADRLSDDSNTIQSTRRAVDQEIRQTVTEINRDLTSLAALNLDFARSGATPDLLDRRDELLRSLGGNVDIVVTQDQNQGVAVYTRDGAPLLDGRRRVMTYTPASMVTPGTVFGSIRLAEIRDVDPTTGEPVAGARTETLVTSGVRRILTPELQNDAVADPTQQIVSNLTGGRLQGLIEARDQLLPEIQDQLDELAGITRFALDAAHNETVPYPLPSSLVGSRTDLTGFSTATRSGTGYLAVVDANGQTLATIGVDVAAAADETALVAQIQAGLGALGTATIDADGAVSITLADPANGLALDAGDSRISVADAAGRSRDYGLAHYLGLNDFFATSGTGATGLAVRPDLVADTSLLGNVRMTVDAGPPAVATAGGNGDRRGAQRLAEAMDVAVATIGRGQLPAGTATIADYAADIVAVAAAAASAASDTVDAEKTMLEQVDTRRSTVSGVNMDEELSRLVLYQQSYTVSARLISVANELFDELVSLGR